LTPYAEQFRCFALVSTGSTERFLDQLALECSQSLIQATE
jgi:hypothetical protein